MVCAMLMIGEGLLGFLTQKKNKLEYSKNMVHVFDIDKNIVTRNERKTKLTQITVLTSKSVLILVGEHNNPILLDGDSVSNRGQVGPRPKDDHERSERGEEDDVAAYVPLQRKHQRYDNRA